MSSPKIFKYYATLLLGFFIALSSFAQSYIFRNYTTEDGLPHSKVFNVLQTNDGYIWIATEGGLSIYNGQYFSNKSTQDSLAESNASALAQDESGNVWIGHLNGGISVFNGTSFRSIKLPEGLNPKRIFSLFIDHEGTLWIGTLGSGVLAVAKDDRKTWNHVKSYTKADGLWDIVTGTFEDSQHKLWFVTDGGLMWFNAKEKSFTVFKHDEMPNFVITSITETKEKDLIFGTYQGGLVILHGKTNKIEIVNAGKGFPSNDIFSLYTDRDGVTWVGTWGAGIVKYHDKIMDHFSKNEGLSGNFIRCFFMDREGNQWIGTNESGVSCFKGKKFALFAKENGLPNPLVNALAIDPSGKIWVGTKDGLTIYRLAPDGSLRSASNVPLKELLNKDIRSLSYVGGGKILVGTNNAGAVLIDTARGAFKRGFVLPENIVNTLIGTRNGTIWFGTTAGITRFDEKTNSFKNYGSHDEFGGKDISDIIEDRNGKIWVACRNGGLTSMDPASEQFRHFSEKDGFTSKSPVSISEDSQGRLWIGTEGSGVFSFDGKTFRQYHIKDGLPSDFITFVKCEKEIVWVGTNKGISKFIPSKGTCRNYNTSDGLVNNETRTNAVASDAEGNIYFGTSQGMMRYSPALDTPNQIEPLTHITRFSVYLTEMNMKKDTVLDYTQHDISFEFIGLSFSGSENVR